MYEYNQDLRARADVARAESKQLRNELLRKNQELTSLKVRLNNLTQKSGKKNKLQRKFNRIQPPPSL